MIAQPAKTPSAVSIESVLAEIRPGPFWRATVLLRCSDPSGLLPRPWPPAGAADWIKSLAKPQELAVPDSPLELLKDGTSSLVVKRFLNLGAARPEVFCKLSYRRNLLRKAIGLLRRSRPSRNWKVAWALLSSGIPTALPVAVFEKRFGFVRLAAGIITQSLLPGKELEDFIHQDSAGLSEHSRRRLTIQAAHLIHRLHRHNFFHRDLKGRNIFVHLAPAGEPRLFFLDLDGCRPRNMGYLHKVKSLSRLARASLTWPVVSRTARLRFLKAYLHNCPTPPDDWKEWWKDIDRQVWRKFRVQEQP